MGRGAYDKIRTGKPASLGNRYVILPQMYTVCTGKQRNIKTVIYQQRNVITVTKFFQCTGLA